MATIKDVARLSGTSVSSVSKVLRGKEIRITDQKRQKIIDAAEALHYMPNSIAANLKSGRQNAVALLCPDLSDPYYPKLAKNIMLRLETLGQKSVIYDYNSDPEKVFSILHSLRDGSVNSVILLANSALSHGLNVSRLDDSLQHIGIPVIVVGSGKLLKSGVCITYDEYQSGQMIAQHLLSMNHRCIGIIAPKDSLFAAGIRETLSVESGCTCLHIDDCERFEGGYEACKRLVGQKITAVAAASDQLAIGAASYALQLGLALPSDIAITGVGDLAQGRIFPVPITTVRYSAPRLAEYTIDTLLRLLKDPQANVTDVLLTPKLLVRNSTTL